MCDTSSNVAIACKWLGTTGVNVLQAIRDLWELLKPGGKLHPTYIIEHKGHVFFEIALTVVIAYLLFQRSYKPSAKQEKPLTDKVSIPVLHQLARHCPDFQMGSSHTETEHMDPSRRRWTSCVLSGSQSRCVGCSLMRRKILNLL